MLFFISFPLCRLSFPTMFINSRCPRLYIDIYCTWLAGALSTQQVQRRQFIVFNANVHRLNNRICVWKAGWKTHTQPHANRICIKTSCTSISISNGIDSFITHYLIIVSNWNRISSADCNLDIRIYDYIMRIFIAFQLNNEPLERRIIPKTENDIAAIFTSASSDIFHTNFFFSSGLRLMLNESIDYSKHTAEVPQKCSFGLTKGTLTAKKGTAR